MKLKGIHKVFKQIAVFQLKYRWLCMAVLLAVTLIGFAGLKFLRITSATEDIFVKNDKEAENNEQRFKELFGSNDTIVLLIEADNVFKPEVLKVIKTIGNELLEKVPYADSLISITDMDITIGKEDAIEIGNPFKDGIPEDAEELQKARDFIMSRKSIVNKLLSADATETLVVVSLKATPPEDQWSKTSNRAPMYVIGDAAISIVENPKYKSSAYTIKAAGLPYTETEEKEVMRHEAVKSIGLSFICMIVLLIVFSKSFRGTIVPIAATFFAITTVLGFMGLMNIAGNSEMISLPIILAMALAVGYSIHLVNSFRNSFYKLGKRKEAVIESIENTGWPLFFTVITTAASVLSFLTTDLQPIRWVGMASAGMIFAVYIYVSILIPILMSFGKDCIPSKNKNADFYKRLDTFFEKFGRYVIKFRKPILISFTAFTAVCIPALFMITVNMDSFNFMGTRIPYVRRIYEITQSQLGSYFNYNIMLTFDEPDSIKNPEVLKKIDSLIEHIGTFKLTKLNNGVPKIFSVLDIVKEMNQTMHSDNPDYYKIPEDPELLTHLLFLYELSGGSTSRWVDDEYGTMRISVDVTAFDGNEIAGNMKSIREKCSGLFPNAKCFLTGSAAHFAEMNNKIVFGELYSFMASLAAIAFLMMVVFGSFKMGLIGLVPNLMPVITIGGIMGYLHIPLDMMTMTIMPMILGIAVDDTIHFTNHAKYIFENELSYKKAILETFYSIGKTLTMTTVILSLTFLMYLTCKIDAILRLGVLAAVGLLSALIADYLMTPVLIYITHPFGKEK